MCLDLLCKNQYFCKVLLTVVILVCVLSLGLVMSFLGSLLSSVCEKSEFSRELHHKISFASLMR